MELIVSLINLEIFYFWVLILGVQGRNIYQELQKQMSMENIWVWILVGLVVGLATGNSDRCPTNTYKGSIFSDQLIAAYQTGLIPLSENQQTHCYDYPLPYTFSSQLDIAISIHDFEASNSQDLYFYVKPINANKTASPQTSITFAIRTQWKYTKWSLIAFSFFIEDHKEIEAGYYQVDSGALAGCRNENTEILLPFRNLLMPGKSIIHKVFIHGFQIHTISRGKEHSPYQIQIASSTTNTTGVIVGLSVTSYTQVNSIYLSFIAFQELSVSYEHGNYEFNPELESYASYTPVNYIPKNFARIYGLTGFILLKNNNDIKYKTEWDGQRFLFKFGANENLLKYFSFQYIFFVGSECSDCPGYPISYESRCLNHCPSGTFLTDKNTCVTCGKGMEWNGTSCVQSCPQGQFLNARTSKCECPPTLNWNGQICIPCLNGKIFDKYTKTCECPKPLRWNGFACAQMPECTGGKEWDVYTYTCQCPQYLFWDEARKICREIPTCSGGQVLDMSYKCVCPSNYYWNGKICTYSNCFGGQVWDGTKCSCLVGYNFNGKLCIQCINGQVWDSDQKICKCEPGYKWNGNFCEISYECQGNMVWNEQYKVCVCSENYYWSGYTCLPLPNCQNGQIWNKSIQKCVCPSNQHFDGNKCVFCRHGSVWDQEKLKCICPPGTLQKDDHCEIIQQCSGGKMWMQHLKSCQCPVGTQWNGNFCISNPCEKGRVWSEEYKSCVCPDFKVWDGEKCIPPQISCTNGQIWNPAIYACSCPDGFYNSGSTCQKIPICSPGMHYNPLNKKCACKYEYSGNQCSEPKCLSGQLWNGYKCTPISCPPPSYFSNGSCINSGHQLCPDGYKWRQQKCVLEPVYCPNKMIWKDLTCKPDSNCNQGFYMDQDGKCSALPQKCIPPTYWDGNSCAVINQKCPQGAFYKGNRCEPIEPCKTGYQWDEKAFICRCPVGSIETGQKCIKCQYNMVYIPNKGCQCPAGTFDSGTYCEQIKNNRCSNVPNSYWSDQKCMCRPGFTKRGYQCICEGVQIGNLCDLCSYKPNSEWVNNKCKCKDNYTQINNKCIPNNECHGTDSPNFCNVGSYFDQQRKMCLSCPDGCLSCKNCDTCEVCRPGFSFDIKTQNCIEHCGDGKRFILECDDKNNIDGDGCSCDCKVQSGYVCKGGSPDSKDTCTFYKPLEVTLKQTGVIRKTQGIVLNINADYLPKQLILSHACENECQKILLVQIISGDKSATSIQAKYIPGTRFTFNIAIDFNRNYIGQFGCMIRINPEYQKYFGNVRISKQLVVSINPAYLAKINDEDQLQ